MFGLRKKQHPPKPTPPSWDEMLEDFAHIDPNDAILKHKNNEFPTIDTSKLKDELLKELQDSDSIGICEYAKVLVNREKELMNTVKKIEKKEEELQNATLNLKKSIDKVKIEALTAIS